MAIVRPILLLFTKLSFFYSYFLRQPAQSLQVGYSKLVWLEWLVLVIKSPDKGERITAMCYNSTEMHWKRKR